MRRVVPVSPIKKSLHPLHVMLYIYVTFFEAQDMFALTIKSLSPNLNEFPTEILASSTAGIVTLVDRIRLTLKRRLAKYPSEIPGLSFTVDEVVFFQHCGRYLNSL